MLTLDEIRKRLEDRNLSKVGRELNISAPYMQQLFKGTAKNPTLRIIKLLSDYLEKRP